MCVVGSWRRAEGSGLLGRSEMKAGGIGCVDMGIGVRRAVGLWGCVSTDAL